MLSTYHFRTDFEESRAGVDEDLEQIEKNLIIPHSELIHSTKGKTNNESR
jgi:hypothetical protein